MKRVLSVLAVAFLVFAVGFKISQDPFFARVKPTNTPVSPTNTVGPSVAMGFFSALCAENAAYLASNMGGNLASTEEEIAAYFASGTTSCFGYRYLGTLTSATGYKQYIAVLDYGADGEAWYVATFDGELAIGLE